MKMTNHNYQEIIDDLAWLIEAGQGEFTLTFVRCNYPQVRQEIMAQLHGICEVEITELSLDKTVSSLFKEIAGFIEGKEIKSLVIVGLEKVSNLDHVLVSANLQRERFRDNFPFPVVIWVNDFILDKFNDLAKDFQTWAGIALRVEVNVEDLIGNALTKIDDLFNKIMEVGCADFPSNESVLGISYPFEFESVVKDIEKLKASLPPELEGGIEFIKGRDFYQQNKFDVALVSYHNCLNLWQNLTDISPLKIAILQFNLGLSYYRLWQKKNQQNNHNLTEAKGYLEGCINIFKAENREDLVAKFINCLGSHLAPVAKLARK